MIKIGTMVSFATVYYHDNNDKHVVGVLPKMLEGKKTIMFGGPVPFGKLETEQALDFANMSNQLLEHVDQIFAIYCQDSYVTREFQRKTEAATGTQNIQFIADGNADFISKHFLSLDLSKHGLGLRSQRWAGIFNTRRELDFLKVDNFTRYNFTKPNYLLEYLKSNTLK
jgi:peroxiredoxin